MTFSRSSPFFFHVCLFCALEKERNLLQYGRQIKRERKRREERDIEIGREKGGEGKGERERVRVVKLEKMI